MQEIFTTKYDSSPRERNKESETDSVLIKPGTYTNRSLTYKMMQYYSLLTRLSL